MLLHLGDRTQDVVAGDVAQHAHLDAGPRRTEGLGRIVVAIRTGEDGDVDQRMLHGLAGVGHHTRGGRRGHHRRRIDPLVGIDRRETLRIGTVELLERHAHAVDRQGGIRHRGADLLGMRVFERTFALDQNRAVGVFEELLFVDRRLDADAVSEGHLRQTLGHAAEADGPRREDLARGDGVAHEGEVALELLRIGHAALQRRMAHEIDPMSGPLQVGRDDRAGIDRRDAEGHEHRRHVDMLEGARHGVLAADRGKSQLDLHPQGAEQGAEGLAPAAGVVRHALEILLVRIAHVFVARTGRHDLRRRLDNGIGGAVVGAPGGDIGVVAEGHDAGRIGISVRRELLHRDLRLAALRAASEGHEHRRTADRRVEHLDQTPLREHVVVAQVVGETLGKRCALDLPGKGIAVLHLADAGLGIVLRAGAVDELAAQIDHLALALEHAHAARGGYVGNMHRLDVLLAAVTHELLHVARLDDHGHALLRLADGQLRGIQTVVFRLHAVEVDVQTVGQLADGDAHAAGAEVVRLLDQARNLRAAEQPLELALLGGVALLHLAAARLERLSVVLLRGSRGAADAVAARAAAQHDDPVPGLGTLAAHVLGLHGTHHGAYLKALGHIVRMVDLTDVGRGQTDLVAVARIARGGLLRDDALRELARERVAHLLVDISGTRNAHGLVDVAAARQRVADRAAQAGRGSSERLDLGRVVVCLVLELQEPLLGLPVHIDIDIDRAGVVLLRNLQIVQQPLLAEVACADRRDVHQADALVLAAQLAADPQVEGQRILDLLLDEGLLDGDALQLGREGRMAAVVAPVGIEDAQLGFIGIAPLPAEVAHHLAQVVGIHRQPLRGAVALQRIVLHLAETFEHRDGLHLGLLHVAQHREVLLARLDGVDVVVADLRQLLVGYPVIEEQQLRRADAHVGRRVYQPHAVHGRSGPLVELSGQVLHGDVLAALEVARIGYRVGYHLAEDRVAALFEQLLREAEQVVDVQQAQVAQREVQIRVELPAQALGLNPEAGQFLNENAVVGRIHRYRNVFSFFCFVTRSGRPTCGHTPRRSCRRR